MSEPFAALSPDAFAPRVAGGRNRRCAEAFAKARGSKVRSKSQSGGVGGTVGAVKGSLSVNLSVNLSVKVSLSVNLSVKVNLTAGESRRPPRFFCSGQRPPPLLFSLPCPLL